MKKNISKPLLLHALSLHDRMLEPAELPLLGRVWGFAKSACSRETFIGNCLSVLGSLGMEAESLGSISEIMTFDVKAADKTYTVVISLSDDSLASQHYYFLGLWQRPTLLTFSGLPNLPIQPQMLQPALGYSLLFAAEPMQYPMMAEILGGDPFSQSLYEGNFILSSNANFDDVDGMRFVIAPSRQHSVFNRLEVRHCLYSIRNITALTARVLNLYTTTWEEESEIELYRNVMLLMQRINVAEIAPHEWDVLVREVGNILLQIAEQAVQRDKRLSEVNGLAQLLQSIISELHSERASGHASLFSRCHIPYSHAVNLLNERLQQLRQTRKQAEVLFGALHSRMLANQQKALAAILERM